jgi:hypothetical protein
MRGSARRKSRTFLPKARITSGNEAFASSHEKKVSRTRAQPGDVRITTANRPSTTTVASVATVAERRCSRRRTASRSRCRGLGDQAAIPFTV